MNKRKIIYYICNKCGAEYRNTIPKEDIPLKTKKDKDGNIIVLSTRKIPICSECGSPLERRVEYE